MALLLLACLWLTVLHAMAGPVEVNAAVDDSHTLHVYVRSGCPHCADAKDFLTRLQGEKPQLKVAYHWVDSDPAARDALLLHSRSVGIWPPGVPTFVYQGRVWVGFDNPAASGPALRYLLGDADIAPVELETRWFGTLSESRLGLPAFALVLGLLDGFNPCAMWVLLFLLSLLVRLRDRRRMALVAGTFVLVSGAVYYLFMAAWVNLFLAVGMSNPLRLLLAFVALVIGAINIKDCVAWGRGPSLSIPDAAKPGIYSRTRKILLAGAIVPALFGVAALAVVVNLVELLCTAGLPAIFTAVLAQHSLDPAGYYGYLGLYILGYIADDTLMTATAVLALSHQKLTERSGRRLKLLSGIVMAVLGAVLLLRPDWLF